jgi:hypothetical protein
MRIASPLVLLASPLATAPAAPAQGITAAGKPAQLDIRAAGEGSIRVTLNRSSSATTHYSHPRSPNDPSCLTAMESGWSTSARP